MKLTKALRDHIVERVDTVTFADRRAAIKQVEADLNARAYDFFVGDKNKELIQALPKDYFTISSNIRVKTLDGETIGLTGEARPVPAVLTYWHTVDLDGSVSDLSDDIIVFRRQYEQLSKDAVDVRHHIRCLVNSVSTLAKLKDVWPEVNEYLPETEEPMSLPAVRSDEINALLARVR